MLSSYYDKISPAENLERDSTEAASSLARRPEDRNKYDVPRMI